MIKAMGPADDVLRGREAVADGDWPTAYASLDRAGVTEPEDLERLATAAFLVGRDGEHALALERAHRAHLEAGAPLRAARCAFWIGLNRALRGESATAGGWFARARRLVERHSTDCVERGYLLVPDVIGARDAGEHRQAHAAAAEAVAVAERFGDRDLLALALHEQGYALVALGRLDEGLGLVDEAMIAVCAGELSPIVTGLVYCSAIDRCLENFELRRAQEWTGALTRWCEDQPGLVAFTGRCLVHRSELLQLHGAWDAALTEARHAGRRAQAASSAGAAGQAAYREAELCRLRGAFAEADRAYRKAGVAGREPQPGSALLRLAQGRPDAAAAAISRALGETAAPLFRARLLPAAVEIALAGGDAAGARIACDELATIAAGHRRQLLDALVADAQGAVALAQGNAPGAVMALRNAAARWRELEAPYEEARARELLGRGCRAVGDEDAAALELEAARAAFAALGAVPDRTRVDALLERAPYGLSARELEVLRRVAAGETNRAIAAALVLSERTVDRHVSNILAKLGVASRTAAATCAYERRLV
jgi:DNA-binding NarL/FixJ family response regulator